MAFTQAHMKAPKLLLTLLNVTKTEMCITAFEMKIALISSLDKSGSHVIKYFLIMESVQHIFQ